MARMVLPHPLERLVVMASDGRSSEILDHLPNRTETSPEDCSSLLVRLSFYGGTSWLPPLLERGADPTYREDTGDTALSECLSGSSRRKPTFLTFGALLKVGADPNEICRGGSKILQLAIMEDRPEFAGLLLLYGADPRLPSPRSRQTQLFSHRAHSRKRLGWPHARPLAPGVPRKGIGKPARSMGRRSRAAQALNDSAAIPSPPGERT